MTKTNNKLDHLVSARGIAAWLVVLLHSMAMMPASTPEAAIKVIMHGYLAVDFFFVLSGFIIFINYYTKFDENFREKVFTFYWNRFSRIYPLHLLMLLAYLMLALAFTHFSTSGKPPASYTSQAFLESVFLVQGWSGNPTAWNVPSWSISAEWFVYLLFPFMTIAMRKWVGKLGTHLFLCASLLLAIYLIYAALGIDSLGKSVASMALVRAFVEFSLGTLIGSLFIHHRPLLMQSKILLAGSIASIAAAYIFLNAHDYVIAPLSFFLLVAYLSVDDSFVSKLLSNKALVYLGEISYSTYMVHYFVYDLFKAGWVKDAHIPNPVHLYASFIVVLLLSMLTHKFVEVPTQRYLRDNFFRLPSRPTTDSA